MRKRPAPLAALCLAAWWAVVAPSARAAGPEAAPGAAGADAGELDDLDLLKLLNVEVSTATKTAESLDEAPAVITVVTRADIQRWGYRSVADVLSHTVGFYLIDDHILPNAGVRGVTGGLGAESGVIKVMIDGRSVAYRTTSGNWLGMELIPLESVAQIEIIRGPASALYGADAFLGVINIITVRPDALRPVRARLSLSSIDDDRKPGGSFDVVGGGQAGHFHLMLGAAGAMGDRSGLELPPESPAPTLPSYVGDRRTALDLKRRSLTLQARAGWSADPVGHVIVSAYGSGFRRGGDFAHWAQLTAGTDANGDAAGTVVALQQLRLNVDTLLRLAHGIDLAVAGTYSQGGYLPEDRVEIASDVFYVERKGNYRGFDATAEVRFIPSTRFNLIAGTEAVFDREQFGVPERVNRATGERVLDGDATDQRVDLLNLGAYLSSNLKVIDPWLKLTGGVRYDHHNKYGEQINGRLGLTSRLSRTLVAKLLGGTAFKAPSPYLLYATPLRPGDVVGNPALRPQRIQTGELQLSWKPSRYFGITSGVSVSRLLDKAEFTPQGINLAARNVARQQTFSWETRADTNHGHDFTGYASFELVQSVRNLGQEGYAATLIGSKNVVYPPWIARAGLEVAVPVLRALPLAVGSQGMLVAKRRAADTSLVEHGSDFYLPMYGLLEAHIATRELYLIRGHETRFAVRGRNLLGVRGPDPGFSGFEYPLAPRTVLFEVEHAY